MAIPFERSLEVKIQTRGLKRMIADFERAGENIRPAISRAINWTGNKARTQVRRAVVKQTGLKYSQVKNATRTVRATYTRLVYRIIARGSYFGIEEFKPKQTPAGVEAAPWNKRRVFPHTFIIKAYHGRVYERTTTKRWPLRRVWGPAIPVEMIKGESKAAFERVVSTELPSRLGHEINAILGGSVP